MTISYADHAPGVWVEPFTPAGPITGVGTSTAAFIGVWADAPNSTVGTLVVVTSWTGFKSALSDVDRDVPLTFAVRSFFENGGTLAYVLPVEDNTSVEAALTELSRHAEVSIVAAPGIVDAPTQLKVVLHCAGLRDRFAVLDAVQTDPDPVKPDGPVQKHRAALAVDAEPGSFAALYWPWIQVPDPGDASKTLAVPPSGAVAGVMARCDNTIGVHKAPANEGVRGAADLAFMLNNTEQGVLNKAGINALRRFPGGPPLVWGARTLSSDINWRYVNVRRLVAYIEDSVKLGVQWAVFRPNNMALWKQLERSITEFLTRIWESGALFGATAPEAFYVKVDRDLNPDSELAQGKVNVEIGLAPTRPAEYVVLRIGLWDGAQS